MPSQKLKRISLGIVSLLVFGVLLWLLYNVRCLMQTSYCPVYELDFFAALNILSLAFILILGLYVIAKILIEIFK